MYISLFYQLPLVICTLVVLSFAIKLFGIHVFKLTNVSEIKTALRDVSTSSIVCDGEPAGILLSRKFIGYIYSFRSERGTQQYELYLICRSDYVNKVTNRRETGLKYWIRTGTFYNIKYIPTRITFDLEPLDAQKDAVENIVELYHRKSSVTCYIHGVPGAGKSSIAYIIASRLKANLVESFNPSEPNDDIYSLVNTINPTKAKPLVILINEVNSIVGRFPIEQHKQMPISIRDKMNWNNFFDHFAIKHPNVILLMTSNCKDLGDPSLLRTGRIDMNIAM